MLSIDDIFEAEIKPKTEKDQAEIIAFSLAKNSLDQIKINAKESQDLALIRELLTAKSESGGHGEKDESVINDYLRECQNSPDFMQIWLSNAKAWKAKQRAKSPPLLTSKSSAILRACTTCKHRATVGIRAVYCGGGRDDLSKAYGINHPLRKLPRDGGATCEKWLDVDSELPV